ncbi:BMP family lipoprotein [Bacillaceae bacterium W0354]
MKSKKLLFLLTLVLSFALFLAACGTSDDDDAKQGDDKDKTNEQDQENKEDDNKDKEAADFSVGMVTDVGGVDDKSFNQSAWEGLVAFGEENGLSEGQGYDYAQSSQDSDYEPNLTRLTMQGYNLVYGIGFLLTDAIEQVAERNPDTMYGLVDAVAEGDNIVNITFKEHQGSFLVGVAAALKSESGKVGFVGGVDSPLINKFEVGFVAGVKSVDPSIEVDVRYADSFEDASKGRQIASSMYQSGIDVIYHAAGGAGNGVFNEAKDIKNSNPDAYVWVIGVDRNQHDEGAVSVGGEDYNVTLTSMVKRVDVAVQDISTRAMNGEFPGGEVVEYGLSDGGISVADTNKEAYTEDIKKAVEDWQQKILDGEVDIPSTHDELDKFLEGLK